MQMRGVDEDSGDYLGPSKGDMRREALAVLELAHRLVEHGDEALAQLLVEYPHADRQHLRQLARNAREERLKNTPPHAYRELFRELRALLGESAQEDEAG